METIIWIDDDDHLTRSFSPVFEEFGFKIVPCNTIVSGLREVMKGTSDKLLLDVEFRPGEKEGLIFLEQIKRINPEIKVVVFTGYPELIDAVRAVKDLMAADYISKPVPLDDKALNDFFMKLRKAFSHAPHPPDALWRQRQRLKRIADALDNFDLRTFFNILKALFGSMSYNMKTTEGYYHAFIHLVLGLIGMNIESEVETNQGRIDAVVTTASHLYLFEFKLSDAQVALDQIMDRKYFQKYLDSGKQIILVGVAFDTVEKNISDYAYKPYP